MLRDDSPLVVRLSDGIEIGDARNPLVYLPGVSSVAVDGETRDFLEWLAQRPEARFSSLDAETVDSLRALSVHGIIKIVSDPSVENVGSLYRPELTDLSIRKSFPLLEALIGQIASWMSRLLSLPAILIGTALLVLEFGLWTSGAFARLVMNGWLENPIVTFAGIVILQTVGLIVHEAAHYGVATRHGARPKMGIGVYLTGPVAYTDLSCLDARPKKVRIAADLAGLGADGAVGVVATIAALGMNSPVLSAICFAFVSTSVGSAQPLLKGDAYWLMRDLFDGREMTFTWSRPIALARCALSKGREGRLAKALIVLYAAAIAWVGVSAPAWLGVVSETLRDSQPGQLVVPVTVSAIFILAAALGTVLSKANRR